MAMERKRQTTGEDKDALIQHCNKLLARKGFDYLKQALHLTRGELTDCIKRTKLMSDHSFTSKDAIVLHFNRYQDTAKMQQFTDHVATHKFPTRSVAKAFIEATIREAWERIPAPSKNWLSKDRLALNDWIIITAAGPYSLEQIMSTSTDTKYKLPAPYDYYAEQIMAYHWGLHPQVNSRTRASKHQAPISEQERIKYEPVSRTRISNERGTSKPQKNASPEPQRASQAASAPRAAVTQPKKPSGPVVSLEALCLSLKLEPRAVRHALRVAKYEKPGARWEWPKTDAEKITADIKRICK